MFFEVSDNKKLKEFSANLESVGGFEFLSNDLLESVEIIIWNQGGGVVNGDIYVCSNKELKVFHNSCTQNVTGKINVVDNENLRLVTFPNMVDAKAVFIHTNNMLGQVDLSSLDK